ncbi:MAG: helix-hairpin-helix domain-containing protein, partial [Candidatus Latescibacteria bacterium]|nr:helix-hairpin-helix domain-containing protein [Candidatus Latescibacterota bacterium]
VLTRHSSLVTRHCHTMLTLTPQERRAILFLAASLAVGGVVSVLQHYRADVAPDLRPDPWMNTPALAAADTGTATTPPSRTRTVSRAAGRDSTAQSSPGRAGRRSGKAIPPSTPINLNTASSAQFQTLPGIGPKLAERIIAYRRQIGAFSTVEQLMNVKGIGRATLVKIKPWVRVDSPHAPPR